MTNFVTVSDLQVFTPNIDEAKAQEMIDDATALAALYAPCINDPDFAYESIVRAILRAAILRWNEAGSGALQSQSAGPFGQVLDTRQERRGMFWPSEITQLQNLCSGGSVYTTSLAGPEPSPAVDLGWA